MRARELWILGDRTSKDDDRELGSPVRKQITKVLKERVSACVACCSLVNVTHWSLSLEDNGNMEIWGQDKQELGQAKDRTNICEPPQSVARPRNRSRPNKHVKASILFTWPRICRYCSLPLRERTLFSICLPKVEAKASYYKALSTWSFCSQQGMKFCTVGLQKDRVPWRQRFGNKLSVMIWGEGIWVLCKDELCPGDSILYNIHCLV